MKEKSCELVAMNLAQSGADCVRVCAPCVNLGTLKRALEIAEAGDPKQYSKTLLLTLDREIRKRDLIREEKTMNKSVSHLVNTSVEDLRSALECAGRLNIHTLQAALEVVERRGEKTKAKMLRSAITRAERKAVERRNK